MKCELSHEKLIAYLYDELVSKDKDEITRHLEQCTDCRQELETLGSARSVLQVWPDEDPGLNLRFAAKPGRFFSRFKTGSRTKRVTIGFGLGLAGALLLLSLINFEASYSNDGFSIKMGLIPRSENAARSPEAPDIKNVTREEFLAWQEESLKLTSRLLADLEAQQRRQHTALLADFASEFEYQRRQDLRFMGKGLESFQLSNENRFRQTNEVLNRLILASYAQTGTENGNE